MGTLDCIVRMLTHEGMAGADTTAIAIRLFFKKCLLSSKIYLLIQKT
jgi:hypothetical protein